jgi:hypothetical protein
MGKKKNNTADNYVQYKYKDRTPKELSKKAKIILGVILAILVISTGFLGYELKTTTMIKENAIAYQEYNPDFDYEHEEEEEKSGWGSITAENLESYKEITSNIEKEKEENKKSDSNSNEDDKGKAPVISKVELASTGTSVTANVKYTDEDSDPKKITIVYSINNGKTWQKSNTFNKLKLSTTYTITAKVTDEKGNSVTKAAKITTPAAAKANVTGVYKSGGSYIQVIQLNTSTIIYSIGKSTMNSTHRATITNNSNGVKSFTGGLKFNSANLIYNGKTYYYSGNVDTNQMFKDYYGGYLDTTSSFNGTYKNIANNGYTMDIVPVRNGVNQTLYVYVTGGGKSTLLKIKFSGSKFSYNAGGETLSASYFRGNVRIETSSTKGSVLATASGDYARYSKFTMDSAVKTKFGL